MRNINLSDEVLDLVDLDSIPSSADKIAECQYFLEMASNEINIQHFRWQVSAFLGAAYSFFEISALCAHQAFVDQNSGEAIEDGDALKVLRRYVMAEKNRKNKSRIDTGAFDKETQAAVHDVTLQLYELRKSNTHHYPLSIMTSNGKLPEAFQFGHIKGKGIPALAFCCSVLSLIQGIHAELEGA